VNGRIDALEVKLDSRFGALETKFDGRFGALDTKLTGRMDRLERDLASAKVWALLLYITLAGAVYGTLARTMGWL
jgi:hypothetical protein